MALAERTQEVRISEGKTGLIKLLVVCACSAIYGVSLWATGFMPTIPGVSWVRPANMLSELFAVAFGGWGCLAAPIGDALSNLMKGTFTFTSIWWVSAIEFFCTAAIVYWGVSDPSLKTTRGKIEWLVFAVILQGLTTGFGIALGLSLQGITPWKLFNTIGWGITLNEALPAIAAGFIQRYFFFPWMVRIGWWWGRTTNVPKDYLAELRR